MNQQLLPEPTHSINTLQWLCKYVYNTLVNPLGLHVNLHYAHDGIIVTKNRTQMAHHVPKHVLDSNSTGWKQRFVDRNITDLLAISLTTRFGLNMPSSGVQKFWTWILLLTVTRVFFVAVASGYFSCIWFSVMCDALCQLFKGIYVSSAAGIT